MEEELATIISNTELDDTAKQEAIKNLVSKEYVPAKVHSEEIKKIKGTLATVNKEYQEYKQTKMTDEEKLQENLLAKSEKEKATNMLLSQMVAENVFSKAGFKEEEYKDFLGDIVGEDYEKTKSFADKICKTLISQREIIEQRVKEQITNKTPTPKDGESGDVTNTKLEQYKKLYQEAYDSNNFSDMTYYKGLIFAEENKK